MLNVLYLYNATQTFTSTVYEHIASFSRFSLHRSFFCHQDAWTELNVDLTRFDAVGIHYSIRLPFDQLSASTVDALTEFKGLKFLFIQDEYDHTYRAWHWIRRLDLQLVFTVVPEAGVERIYPAHQFPHTRFVSVLTGYIPTELNLHPNKNIKPPSQRSLMIGYRGRPLPIRYGRLGIEKVSIGEIVKNCCDVHRIPTDIAWTEEARIYGTGWYEFVSSCRSMLGSESGSNVFDWDGTLVERIAQYRKERREAKDGDIYRQFVQRLEMDGIMNQVSPRVFEAIAAKTVLVLYEGTYSGVVTPGVHFIPVRKDGSNLAEVLQLLLDGEYVDAMADRAYKDVILSGNYSYRAFVGIIDNNIELSHATLVRRGNGKRVRDGSAHHAVSPTALTILPIRAEPPLPVTAPLVPRLHRFAKWFFNLRGRLRYKLREFGAFLWLSLPQQVQTLLRSRIKRLLGME
jgi:hypothetical protein